MNTTKKIFSLLIFIVIISACGNDEVQNQSTISEVATENLIVEDYTIDGMVCAMGCAATIEKDVAGMDGVFNADVDYETGKAHFEFDNAIVSEKEIITKIESIADGQYKVGKWTEKSVIEEIIDSKGDEEVVGSEEGSISEVSLPSFEIPNLFTLLLDQI